MEVCARAHAIVPAFEGTLEATAKPLLVDTNADVMDSALAQIYVFAGMEKLLNHVKKTVKLLILATGTSLLYDGGGSDCQEEETFYCSHHFRSSNTKYILKCLRVLGFEE